MAFTVYKLQYDSSCAYCDQGLEASDGLRLLQTQGNARKGFDFHRACWEKVLFRVGSLDAPDLVEHKGIWYTPEEAPIPNIMDLHKAMKEPFGAPKQIPKRR